jgi:hypothetical protein
MKTEQLTPREIDWDNGYAAGLIDGRKGKKAMLERVKEITYEIEGILLKLEEDLERIHD